MYYIEITNNTNSTMNSTYCDVTIEDGFTSRLNVSEQIAAAVKSAVLADPQLCCNLTKSESLVRKTLTIKLSLKSDDLRPEKLSEKAAKPL